MPENSVPEGHPVTCGCQGPCIPLPRREFLKLAGLTTAGGSLLAATAERAAAEPSAPPPAGEIQHFVPADKNLPPEWTEQLTRRGLPEIYTGEDLLRVGMPVGGIAAGQLYLRGDGTLTGWAIDNQEQNTGPGTDNYFRPLPESTVQQGFAVVIDGPAGTRALPLSVQGFPQIRFLGQYPVGVIEYAWEDVPLRVTMEAFSPFIPLNARDSGLPATVFNITLLNTSQTPLRATVLGWLQNMIGRSLQNHVNARRRSRRIADRNRGMILHGLEVPPEDRTATPPRPPIVLADFEGENYGDWKVEGEAFGDRPARGTWPTQSTVAGFQGKGLVNTFIRGDGPQGSLTSPPFTIERRFLNFLIGGGNHPGRTCLNLLIDGQVVASVTGRNDEKLEWRHIPLDPYQGREAVIQILDRHSDGWGHINVDQIELADLPRIGEGGAIHEQSDYGTLALACAASPADDEQIHRWCAALRPPIPDLAAQADVSVPLPGAPVLGLAPLPTDLPPQKPLTFSFVLAWHFPNLRCGGKRVGHVYNQWGKEAADIASYVLDHHERLCRDTRLWRDTFYGGTLPCWLLHRLHSTVANLASNTCHWWENGRFWAWEGVYCCYGTCTHVWNYAHALARLYPELERSVREMQDLGPAMYGNGLVQFRGEDTHGYAADGQAGTVLKCYREHLCSADDAFLRRNWPRIRLALNYLIAQDADEDGLIENTQHNTFDINFVGPNTFVGSLYLAALRAGEEMAREMGEEDYARRLRKLYESGRKLSVEKLWNGEYFIQLVDLLVYPTHQYADGCLSDQLFGQGWAHLLSLGYIYPREMVLKALAAVYRYNWAPDVGPQNAVHKPWRVFASPGEAGLFTCTWPKSRHLDAGVLYQNEVWTGIEYQVAGHLIWEGMVTEGLTICRAVHERYLPGKRNPYNEIECGDHYARALASWGVFQALAGFEYHGPRGELAFAPRLSPEHFEAAFTAAEGWGSYRQRREADTFTAAIEVRWGRLRLQTLRLEIGPRTAVPMFSLGVGDRKLEAVAELREGRHLLLRLSQPLILQSGQTLEIIVG